MRALVDPRNGEAFDFAPWIGERRVYVIASVPRTGSTLLGKALWDSGLAGAPSEYLNPMQLRDWEVRLGSASSRFFHGLLRGAGVGGVGWEPFGKEALHAHLDRVASRRTGPNGWFGLKVHHHHLAQRFLARGHDLSDWAPVSRWIQIRRRDRLAQAISWVRAIKTGRWAAWQPEGRRPRYDRAAINDRLRAIDESERGWDLYFAARGVAPHVVWYEDLAEDPTATVRGALGALGIDGSGVVVERRAGEVQRDGLSAEWAARWRAGR